MKAFVLNRYGSSENLSYRDDLPIPVPNPRDVLIKIRATAINDYDWSMVRGKPLFYRLLFGLFRPKHKIPGMELAGIIEDLGSEVTRFKKGDAVYGDISAHGFGSFAEYLCIHEEAVVTKPAGMTFEEATALPHASLLAYQGLMGMGQLQEGQKILLNGGGGGVGTIGLQIAKQYNVHVTGVDSGNKLRMMEQLGFDSVLDYKKTDFTRIGEQFDLILDCKTTRSPGAYVRALKQGGKYITVGGKLSRLLQIFLLGPMAFFLTKKRLKILALKPNKDLELVQSLYLKGKIRCIIDGPYPMSKIPELISYFGKGKHAGKVVVSIPE